MPLRHSALRIFSVVLLVGASIMASGCYKKDSDSRTSSGGGVLPPNPTAAQHLLSVARWGTGTGTVLSTPAGIDCGSDCDQAFDRGAVVTLKARAAADSSFAEWSGPCGGAGDCEVTIA